MPAPAKTSLINISNSSSLKFFHPSGSLKDCCPNAEIQSVNELGNRSIFSQMQEGPVLEGGAVVSFSTVPAPLACGDPKGLLTCFLMLLLLFFFLFFQLCQGPQVPQRGQPLIVVVGMGEEVLRCQGPDTIGV